MDLFKAIKELLDEKRKLNEAIAYLEAMTGARPSGEGESGPPKRPPGRRGRMSMEPAERAEVSRRMKEYWEKRRKAAAK
jgi:hypothetical protein